jgi:hypothetical protein|nr:MAG TPA: TBP-interacting protein [Caudoviricetes sp.]
MFVANGKPQRMNWIIRYLMIAALGIRKQFFICEECAKKREENNIFL